MSSSYVDWWTPLWTDVHGLAFARRHPPFHSHAGKHYRLGRFLGWFHHQWGLGQIRYWWVSYRRYRRHRHHLRLSSKVSSSHPFSAWCSVLWLKWNQPAKWHWAHRLATVKALWRFWAFRSKERVSWQPSCRESPHHHLISDSAQAIALTAPQQTYCFCRVFCCATSTHPISSRKGLSPRFAARSKFAPLTIILILQ